MRFTHAVTPLQRCDMHLSTCGGSPVRYRVDWERNCLFEVFSPTLARSRLKKYEL